MIGVGEGEHFIASAIPAFLRETRNVQLVSDDEIVTVRPDGAEFRSAAGEQVAARDRGDHLGRGGGREGRLPDLHAEGDPRAVRRGRRDDRRPARRTATASTSATSGSTTTCWPRAAAIVIVACGTSYHAGLVGRYAIEQWARVPVEMDIASEYRYRNPVVGPGRPRDRHLAVRRDGGHAGRDAPRARARRARCWRSRTSSAARRRATRTACSTRAPASRSASRRPRPSSRRWRRST